MRAAVCAAVIALLFGITACKQFTADINEELGYWAAEVIVADYSFSVPYQTSNDGALCIPSANDVKLTITLKNPKNFRLVMPTSSDDAGKVINFPGLTTQPELGTEYTFKQTGDMLELTYKSDFLKAHEWSTGSIGPEITLMSADGRKFGKKFSLNIEANTPPPEIGDITIAKTNEADPHYVLCFTVQDTDMGTIIAGENLHKDLSLVIAKEGGETKTIPLPIGSSGFTVDTTKGLLSSASQIIDPVPSGTWKVYFKTGTGITASPLPQKYTVRLIDRKGLSSESKEAKTLGYIPDISGADTAWKKLKQAVEGAQEGGVITVMGNVKATNDTGNSGAINVTKSLTIKGKIGTTLDANSNHASPLPGDAPFTPHRIFTVTGDKTELTLENLTLKNGKADPGGAINAAGIKTLTLKHCTIKDCTAYSGGGIYLNGKVEAVLESCTITGCKTTADPGGAIYAGSGSNGQPVVYIKGGSISSNTGYITGGAINITRGSLYINTDENGDPDTMSTTTEIKNNTVIASGGGGNEGGGISCYWEADKPGKLTIENAEITNCNIEYNSSGDKNAHGAGIHVYGKGEVSLSNVTLSQCGFTGESPGNKFNQKQGGGICLQNGAEATIKDCTFKSCKANQGGAFYIETGKANIENCTFIKNSASESGGALHIGNTSDDCNVIINDSVIGDSASNANTASSKGGGICVYRGTCTVRKVNIQNNTASIGGSGIWLHGASDNTAKLTLEEKVNITGNHLMIGNNPGYPAFVTAHNLDAASDIKIRPEVYDAQINKPLVKAAGTKPDNWETLFELVDIPPGQTWELKKNDAGTELILEKTG